MRSPVARSSNRAKATVSPSSARVSFEDMAPISRANPPMRSSTPRELTVAPSAKAPRSTRASDSLPPCAVWIVRIMRQSWPFILNAKPLARMGDARRLVPQRLEEPGDAVAADRRTQENRHDPSIAQFAGQIVEDEVFRRVDVLINCSISASS